MALPRAGAFCIHIPRLGAYSDFTTRTHIPLCNGFGKPAALEQVHMSYLPRDSVRAGLHLHASWRPNCEPPAPPPDPWMRGAARIISRPVPAAAAPRDSAPERTRRQGAPLFCFNPRLCAWRPGMHGAPRDSYQQAPSRTPPHPKTRLCECAPVRPMKPSARFNSTSNEGLLGRQAGRLRGARLPAAASPKLEMIHLPLRVC